MDLWCFGKVTPTSTGYIKEIKIYEPNPLEAIQNAHIPNTGASMQLNPGVFASLQNQRLISEKAYVFLGWDSLNSLTYIIILIVFSILSFLFSGIWICVE